MHVCEFSRNQRNAQTCLEGPYFQPCCQWELTYQQRCPSHPLFILSGLLSSELFSAVWTAPGPFPHSAAHINTSSRILSDHPLTDNISCTLITPSVGGAYSSREVEQDFCIDFCQTEHFYGVLKLLMLIPLHSQTIPFQVCFQAGGCGGWKCEVCGFVETTRS